MARQLRISNPDLEAQTKDVDQLYIGERLFVAVALEGEEGEAMLTPEEVTMVQAALADPRPPLRGAAAVEYLRRRAKELGLD